MAMSKDLKAASQSPNSSHQSQRQRSSTPTAGIIARSNDASNGNTYKSSMQEPSEQQLDAYAASFYSSDRQDLIQRLKQSQSPTLQRNVLNNPFYKPHALKDSSNTTSLLPAIDLESKNGLSKATNQSGDIPEQSFKPDPTSSALIPGYKLTDTTRTKHFPKGFYEDLERTAHDSNAQSSNLSTASWYKRPSSPTTSAIPASPSIDIPILNRTPIRERAPSFHSVSPRYVLKPPTSPLAFQSNNDDMCLSPIDLASSPTRSNRRHTLPPNSFQAMRSASQSLTLAQAARQPPSMQREHSLPYQTHHVRRSYTGLPTTSSPSPSTPSFLRSRRSSFASDASPIQASMVGSYEESILRGRMSTTPSKPLDFTAQIGALGKGDCKPKYPAHVSVDFPAVYYSWHSTNGGSREDEPSPYVGQIDLEHKLHGPVAREKPRKRRETLSEDHDLNDSSVKSREARRNEKRRKRSQSPSSSLQSFGGCYRIPQQGQLQILIKNPHKTAVKLFLVPYNLEGMQPGTKTFVRQRSYSAGPIIEKPLTSRSLSDSVLDNKAKIQDPKPILRYLIQINICCPAQGRFYLYKSIHLVFANRVPDDKEKLQTEILWPEPRYSTWKPYTSDSGASTPARQSFDGDAAKGRNFGIGFRGHNIDAIDGIPAYQSGTNVVNNHAMVDLTRSTEAGNARLAFRNIPLDVYTKLTPGESGYGGRPVTPDSGESLLARRLKSLSSENDGDQDLLAVEDMEMD